MAKRSQLHIAQLNASWARRLGERVVRGGEGECALLGEDEAAGLVGAEAVSPRAGVDGDGIRWRLVDGDRQLREHCEQACRVSFGQPST